MKVLVDTNVLLDVLAGRVPFDAAATRVWAAVETGRVPALVSGLSFATVFYLGRKQFGREPALAACEKIMKVFGVAAVDADVVAQALASGMGDFEDALQAFAAVRAGATHIVSRDVAGFRNGPLPIVTPTELLSTLGPS